MDKIKLNSPLVSIQWLSENINHPDLIILDATIPKVGQTEFSEDLKTKQLPNARFFDLKKTFKDLKVTLPNTMPKPEYFSREAQKLGINKESIIVIYDHHGIYSSPRAWWVFKTMGHQNVAVLNGGFPAWKNANLSIQEKKAYQGKAGNFVASFQPSLLINANEVLQTLGKNDISILDARSEGRFTGTAPEPRADLRGGHIPGSQNLPIAKIIKNGEMLSQDELKKVYNQFDLENKKVIFSCGSGITACVIALGAELAGLENKTVFDGSWTEWGDGNKFPVEK